MSSFRKPLFKEAGWVASFQKRTSYTNRNFSVLSRLENAFSSSNLSEWVEMELVRGLSLQLNHIFRVSHSQLPPPNSKKQTMTGEHTNISHTWTLWHKKQSRQKCNLRSLDKHAHSGPCMSSNQLSLLGELWHQSVVDLHWETRTPKSTEKGQIHLLDKCQVGSCSEAENHKKLATSVVISQSRSWRLT